MSDRRAFLKFSLLTSAIMGGSKALLAFDGKSKPKIIPAVKDQPVVISTWDFGKEANAAAWNVLGTGGRALDAVETGVKVPEADPKNQTVGYGGRPDRDGKVTLDASIMDENGHCGSVACLEHVTHAISVARMVMEKTPHVLLAGEGALQFALDNGFKKENLLTKESEQEWKDWLKESKYTPVKNIENKKNINDTPGNSGNHDTIGMLALDKSGNLSGACTTSGMAYKMHGRVGDSPIIGAGLFVDNEVGAATATGVGEEVIKIVGSHLVVEFMRQGMPPEQACKAAVMRLHHKNPEAYKTIQVGFIALNRKGEYGAFALQKGFSFAIKNGKDEKIIDAKSLY